MGNWITYENIIRKFFLSYYSKNLKILKVGKRETYKQVKVRKLNSKFKFTSAMTSSNTADIVHRMQWYYFDKVFKEGYSLSVEDIARYLDVSVQLVNSKIIKYIDRIELPTNDLGIKSLVKSNLYYYLFREKGDLYDKLDIIEYCPMLGTESFKGLFRKKVLYNINSFISFLKKNCIYATKEKIVIDIEIEDSKELYTDELLELMSKNFLDKIGAKNEFETIPLGEIVDLEYIKGRFAYQKPTAYMQKMDKSNIKSASSLGVIFNTIYLIETNRKLEYLNDVIPFYIYLDGSKTPTKRFIMKSSSLLREFENGLNMDEMQKNIEEAVIDDSNSKIVRFRMNRLFYNKRFKSNSTELKESFLEYLDDIFKSKQKNEKCELN